MVGDVQDTSFLLCFLLYSCVSTANTRRSKCYFNLLSCDFRM